MHGNLSRYIGNRLSLRKLNVCATFGTVQKDDNSEILLYNTVPTHPHHSVSNVFYLNSSLFDHILT